MIEPGTPLANEAIAKLVADRCHGDRKPGECAERYAIIYQAAYLGAIEANRHVPALVEQADALASALETARLSIVSLFPPSKVPPSVANIYAALAAYRKP
jgi:hypothetical protein